MSTADNTSNPKKNNKYTFHTLVMIIQISITFLACQLYIDKVNNGFATQVGQKFAEYPVIRVVDLENLTGLLLEKGYEVSVAAEYGDLYIQTLSRKGYLVIDSKSVIASEQDLTMELPSLEQVREEAKELGIQPKADYKTLLNNQPIIKLIEEMTKNTGKQ